MLILIATVLLHELNVTAIFSRPERLAGLCANSKRKRKYTLFRIPESEPDK